MSEKNSRASRQEELAEVRDTEQNKTKRRNLAFSIAVALTFAVVVAGIVTIQALTNGDDQATAQKSAGDGPPYVRADSHKLDGAEDEKVTLVEFLDFECEACAAYYPVVEQLRAEYQGQVTFVTRYFPLPSHFNSERAARAVEAAAQQGRYEDMYAKMFETQAEWGEQQVPADDTFRGFAEDLGLDLDEWDQAYNDPATLKRIEKDVADGATLEVQGTPAFFLNGKKLEPRSYEEFTKAIDAELTE